MENPQGQEINTAITDKETLEQYRTAWGNDKFEQIKSLAETFLAPLLENLGEGLGRFHQNIARSKNLLDIYRKLEPITDDEKAGYSDILRSAVVFTHAALEDALRTLAANFLPGASAGVLDNIPLKGFNNQTGRAEKFSLGKLAQHQGKLVEDLIRESVEQHLERSNYNSIDEIAALLKNIGLDSSEYSQHFPVLVEMMKRRHEIVHRADRLDRKGHEDWQIKPIEVEEVEGWILATVAFIQVVITQAGVLKTLDFEQLSQGLKEAGINSNSTDPVTNEGTNS